MLSGSIVNSGGGVISSVNSSSGLTSCGGGSGTSGTTWYYNSEYNGGWPKLRVFIKNWTTISFVSSDTSKGTVSPVSIQVPSDADSSKFDDANNSTSTTITIYSQSVTATPKVGCGLEKWEYNSSSKTYTARFKNRTYILGFKAGINTEQTASYGSYCYVGEQYSVTYNTEVTISLISNVKQGYGAVRISFVDAGGHTRSMIYSALPGYYINSYSICNQNKTGSLTYKVTTTGIIEVSAVLKTYDLEFN